MEESRRRVNSCPGDAGSMPTEAVVHLVAGGLFGLLMWWGNGKMRMPCRGGERTLPAFQSLRSKITAQAALSDRPECGYALVENRDTAT